jgi:hypothetical protein
VVRAAGSRGSSGGSCRSYLLQWSWCRRQTLNGPLTLGYPRGTTAALSWLVTRGRMVVRTRSSPGAPPLVVTAGSTTSGAGGRPAAGSGAVGTLDQAAGRGLLLAD